jgi:hypothetical protein
MDTMTEFIPSLPQGSYERQVWYHTQLTRSQLQGLYQGYSASRLARAAETGTESPIMLQPLSKQDILLLQLSGDLEDIQAVYTASSGARPSEGGPVLTTGHCSALVRFTGDDLLVSQDTWSDLNGMLRVYKMYDFPFRTEPGVDTRVSASKVSFSSYPAVLNSGDDFYVASSGLIVLETTIGNSNPDLYTKYMTPTNILEWIRNIVANRLASNGQTWYEIYRLYNSGTYCNQNMIIDYNLFAQRSTSSSSRTLLNNTLLLVEQLPGFVVATDATDRLESDGYFGGYNSGYNEFIRKVGGFDNDVASIGAWASYWDTPRALIFKRDAPSVTDLNGMKKIMRSCDFKLDPLSSQLPTCEYLNKTNCFPAFTAENCIATRGDLNPSNGVWGISAFGHRNHVATDSKISQFSTYNNNTVPADVICGPVGKNDNPLSTPNFKWSESDFNNQVQHLGHPDEFNFPWLRVEFL